LEGATTRERSFQIRLDNDFTPFSNLTLYIGNEFVGYSTLIIRGETITISKSTHLAAITLIAALPISILVKNKLNRKKVKGMIL
jgi:hypothetical protein